MATSQEESGWVCEKCGRQFAKQNQQHVCEVWTPDDHLKNAPAESVALFRRFAEIVASFGSFEYSVTKGNIGFRGKRRIFAGVMPTRQGLKGYLDIDQRMDDPRFVRISPYTQRLFVHAFHLTSSAQLDERFTEYIFQAYRVGQGEHLYT